MYFITFSASSSFKPDITLSTVPPSLTQADIFHFLREQFITKTKDMARVRFDVGRVSSQIIAHDRGKRTMQRRLQTLCWNIHQSFFAVEEGWGFAPIWK